VEDAFPRYPCAFFVGYIELGHLPPPRFVEVFDSHEEARTLYRILRPNGQWIIDESWPEHLRFKDIEAAIEHARLVAKTTDDYGEFLIFENGNDTPSARTRLIPLLEEDE
jgi:hypothetical protein